MGASEFSTAIHDKFFRVKRPLFAEGLDAELQEVREVLEGLRQPPPMGKCWCGRGDLGAPNHEHLPHCQRARALYERLIPKE